MRVWQSGRRDLVDRRVVKEIVTKLLPDNAAQSCRQRQRSVQRQKRHRHAPNEPGLVALDDTYRFQIEAGAKCCLVLQEMALIDRPIEGRRLRGIERADGLDQALDIVTAGNRTAQDRPSQFGVIGKIIEEWVLFSVAAVMTFLRKA